MAIQRMASNLGIERTLTLHRTPEARAKMSIAHLNHKLSESHRASLRRCTLNESAFDLLTEHSTYWIGFMMADANICYKKGIPIIALHLNTIDLPHLLKFREFVGSSHKIGIYRNDTICSVSFACGPKMAQELGKYGFGPRKCFTARLEGGIENNKHTWRGIIDGDGSFNFYPRRNLNGTIRRIPYISVTGSRNICLQFRTFLERQLGEPMPPTIISYKNSSAFMLSDSRAVRAIKLLYGGCTLALDRKVRRAYEILDKYEQKELRDGQIEFPHTF
jgi:hypothetical protein